MDNPLLSSDFLIPFDRIGVEHVVPGVRTVLAEARAAIARIARPAQPEARADQPGGRGAPGETTDATRPSAAGAGPSATPTWDSTIGSYDAVLERVNHVVGNVHHLLGVRDSEGLRNAYDEVNPEISEFHASLELDPGLWRVVKEYAATAEAGSLDPLRRRHLEKTVRSFRRSGADLPDDAKAEVVRLQVELARVTRKFADNVLDSTNAFELVLTDERQLEGLPESAIARARADAEAKELEGWRFTLQAPSYVPFMQHAVDRELRRRMYAAYSNRATEPGRDNRPLVQEILLLRRRLARALGYRDWADYETEERMAGSGERALAFARDLTERTRAPFRRDVAALEAEGRDIGYERLEPWDLAFVMERIRRRRYDLDPEELRPYFPADAVLAGLFEVARRVLGAQIAERAAAPVWHPDVRFFDARDETGTHVGSFYADLFPREGKYYHAAAFPLQLGHRRADGSRRRRGTRRLVARQRNAAAAFT